MIENAKVQEHSKTIFSKFAAWSGSRYVCGVFCHSEKENACTNFQGLFKASSVFPRASLLFRVRFPTGSMRFLQRSSQNH